MTNKPNLRTRSSYRSNGNGHLDGNILLSWHKLHEGVYARVARKLRVDASYVSRVARGERQSDKVRRALISELQRIDRLRPSA